MPGNGKTGRRERRLALAYGTTAFSIAAINNLWVTYNYPFFLSGPLSEGWSFAAVQLVFMVWNAVNDPLFGWLSDTSSATARAGRRLRPIRIGGWMLAFSFVFAWFPWSASNDWFAVIHFFLSLCLYDTALTYLEVNYASLLGVSSVELPSLPSLPLLLGLGYRSSCSVAVQTRLQMLADATDSGATRALCNSYASGFSVLGSLSSYLGFLLWRNGRDIHTFRIYCCAVAVLALPGFEFTYRRLSRMVDGFTSPSSSSSSSKPATSPPPLPDDSPAGDSQGGNAEDEEARLRSGDGVVLHRIRVQPSDGDELAATEAALKRTAAGVVSASSSQAPQKPRKQQAALEGSGVSAFRGFLRQLSKQRNFAVFVVIRLLQVFLCTFEKNHLALFLHRLLGGQVAEEWLGLLVSLSFVLPHLATVLFTTSIGKHQRRQQQPSSIPQSHSTSSGFPPAHSLYSIIRALFVSKGVLALLMLLWFWPSSSSSSSSSWAGLIALYLCAARVITECVCRLFPLVVAELVDEDCAINRRPQSMAASIIGMSALVAKPGESLAPILGWHLLGAASSPSLSTPLPPSTSPAFPPVTSSTAVVAASPSAPAATSFLSSLVPSSSSRGGKAPPRISYLTDAKVKALRVRYRDSPRAPLSELLARERSVVDVFAAAGSGGSDGSVWDRIHGVFATLFAAPPASPSAPTTPEAAPASGGALLLVLLLVPLGVAAVQTLLWSRYSLHGTHLAAVKRQAREAGEKARRSHAARSSEGGDGDDPELRYV